MSTAAKRDGCFSGFAGAVAALVSWLLFARGHLPTDGLTLWLCISLPLLAAGSAVCGARVTPYGARDPGYWGAAWVICLVFPAATGVVVPAPFIVALFLSDATHGGLGAIVGAFMLALLAWSVSFFVAAIVSTPACIVGVAAFHGLSASRAAPGRAFS